jgi:hypothetical protein
VLDSRSANCRLEERDTYVPNSGESGRPWLLRSALARCLVHFSWPIHELSPTQDILGRLGWPAYFRSPQHSEHRAQLRSCETGDEAAGSSPVDPCAVESTEPPNKIPREFGGFSTSSANARDSVVRGWGSRAQLPSRSWRGWRRTLRRTFTILIKMCTPWLATLTIHCACFE